MRHIPLICRSATIFAPGGGLDHAAYEHFMQQFIDNRLGVYVGSAGSGESHALTMPELNQLYRAAVAIAKGKIPTYANPPEQHTARATLEHSLLAAHAGMEVVNIYGPASWHGYKPTDSEFLDFYDAIFAEFRYPAAIAPNPIIGYTPSAGLTAKVVEKHPQVVAINLAGLSDRYFIELQDALTRDVEIYAPFDSSFETLALGATGLLGAEANIIPKTFRRYLDLYAEGNLAAAAAVYADLTRVSQYLKPWHHGSPKWIKMYFKAFARPGAAGGLREPYRMPNDAEIQRFAQGLLALDVAEITEAFNHRPI